MSVPTAEVKLERMRMALAEAGFPQATVRLERGLLVFPHGEVPFEVMWRAGEIASPDRSMCLACCQLLVGSPLSTPDRLAYCDAWRPCTLDCGRDRSEPPT